MPAVHAAGASLSRLQTAHHARPGQGPVHAPSAVGRRLTSLKLTRLGEDEQVRYSGLRDTHRSGSDK